MGLLLVNCDALLGAEKGGGASFGPTALDGVLAELEQEGVRVRFFTGSGLSGSGELARPLGGGDAVVALPTMSDKTDFYLKMKRELSLSDGQIALFGFDQGDIPLMELAGFSAVPSDADLEVKSRAYYVAYGDPLASLAEVAGMIVGVKRSAP